MNIKSKKIKIMLSAFMIANALSGAFAVEIEWSALDSDKKTRLFEHYKNLPKPKAFFLSDKDPKEGFYLDNASRVELGKILGLPPSKLGEPTVDSKAAQKLKEALEQEYADEIAKMMTPPVPQKPPSSVQEPNVQYEAEETEILPSMRQYPEPEGGLPDLLPLPKAEISRAARAVLGISNLFGRLSAYYNQRQWAAILNIAEQNPDKAAIQAAYDEAINDKQALYPSLRVRKDEDKKYSEDLIQKHRDRILFIYNYAKDQLMKYAGN